MLLRPRREEDNKEEGEDNKKNEGETKEEGKQLCKLFKFRT